MIEWRDLADRRRDIHNAILQDCESGMTKWYGYDRNDDGIMLNKRIY